MVQTYQAPVRIYHYPFEDVMKAYELRFPTCELIPLFADSEILDEKIEGSEEDGGDETSYQIRVTKRRCRLKVDAPYLLKKIVGMEYVDFIQVNRLDYGNRILKIEAYNESFSNRVKMSETCYYKVHPQNSNWTCFEQEATLNIISFFNFESILERVVIKHYINSVSNGKEILLHHIRELGIDKMYTSNTVHRDEDIGPISHNKSSNVGNNKNGHILYSNHYSEDSRGNTSEAITNSISGGKIVLTESECEKLSKLKSLIKERLINKKIPNDTHLFRFLKARDFQVDKAYEMLYNSLNWRKHHQIDQIISKYEIPQVVTQYFPGGWIINSDGRPIYHIKLGEMDVKGLYNSLGMDGIIKHVLFICEQGFELCKNKMIFKRPHDQNDDDDSMFSSRKSTFSSSQSFVCDNNNHSTADKDFRKSQQLAAPLQTVTNFKQGVQDTADGDKTPTKIPSINIVEDLSVYNYGWGLVLDMHSIGVKHLWTPGIRAVLKIIETVAANYPETLNCLWVLGAPKVLFPVIWTMVSPMIDEKTRQKFHFVPKILGKDLEVQDTTYPAPPKHLNIKQDQMAEPNESPPDDIFNCFGFLTGPGSPSTDSHSSTVVEREANLAAGLTITSTTSSTYSFLNHFLQSQIVPSNLEERTECSIHRNCVHLTYLLAMLKNDGNIRDLLLDAKGEKVVPKSFYLLESELNDQKNSLMSEDIYQNCSLVKGQYHEVVVSVRDEKSVLTWDFDVTKQDCCFRLIRVPFFSEEVASGALGSLWKTVVKGVGGVAGQVVNQEMAKKSIFTNTLSDPTSNVASASVASAASVPLKESERLISNGTTMGEHLSCAFGSPSINPNTTANSALKQFLSRKNSLSSGTKPQIMYDPKIEAYVTSGNTSILNDVLTEFDSTGTAKFKIVHDMIVDSKHCKDGESQQGSQIITQPGYYVFQWYFPNSFPTNTKFLQDNATITSGIPQLSAPHSSAIETSTIVTTSQSFLSPITTNNFEFDFSSLAMTSKCKISYYIKLLSPQQCKTNSFASLPSMTTSGFASFDDINSHKISNN